MVTIGSLAGFETVCVAAVQATPVILDADATIDKAIDLLGEAADGGATLVVFPECFVSVYPSGAWAAQAASWTESCDVLWERMWASSIDVSGPQVDRLIMACTERGVHLAIGINEREDDRPGSLYNTLLVIGGEGVLHRHRKLMPTMQERVFHGVGAGDDLGVVELPGSARVGGLICWENRMPLARWRVYQGGPQIWLAPTADDSDGWIASMRHIAIEAGAFVVSVPQFIPASAFPGDFPLALPDGVDVFGRGARASCRPAARWSPARSTTQRASSSQTATFAGRCTPSATSTSSVTTAEPTCSRRATQPSRPDRAPPRATLPVGGRPRCVPRHRWVLTASHGAANRR